MQLANDIYRNELTYSFKFLLQFRHMFAGGDSKVIIWIGCLVHTVGWVGSANGQDFGQILALFLDLHLLCCHEWSRDFVWLRPVHMIDEEERGLVLGLSVPSCFYRQVLQRQGLEIQVLSSSSVLKVSFITKKKKKCLEGYIKYKLR